MGARGPQKKPSALKKAQGNPGNKALPQNEAKLELAKPTCPRWLPVGAKRIFRQLVKQLYAMKVISKCEPMLASLALALYRWQEAEEDIEAKGLYQEFEGKNGKYLVQNPSVAAAKSYFEQAMKICDRYGLAPSVRTNAAVIASDKKSELEKLLFGDLDEAPKEPGCNAAGLN